MRTRLVNLGSSRGIRIPEALVEAAGLGVSVRMRVVDSGLLLERVDDPRAGWAEAARKMAAEGADGLLDAPVPTAFDEREWEWK